MADKQGQMSLTRLSMLGGVLLMIWILCYQAQLQLQPRRLLDTYDKLMDRNISVGAFEISNKLAIQDLKTNYNLLLKQKIMEIYPHGLNSNEEKSICVVLTHEETDLTNMKMIKSILSQDYTNYKVVYFKNASDSQNVYKYMEDNALDADKVKMVENPHQDGYLSDFLQAKAHCSNDQIIIFLSDQDQIIGYQAFNLINNLFKKPNTFLYTGSITPKEELGRSYPYPQQIMANNSFSNYPYVAGGINAFSKQLYMSIEKSDLTSDGGQFYKHARNIAFGIKMLKKARDNIIYVNIPLLLDKNEQTPLTLDPELKKEYAEIHKKQSIS